jgi:formylglycine-generating enzyme required for sulfatase activity
LNETGHTRNVSVKSGVLSFRAVRGGDWNEVPANIASAVPYSDAADTRGSNGGFRVLCSSAIG